MIGHDFENLLMSSSLSGTFIRPAEVRKRTRGNGNLLNRKTRKSGHAIFLDRSRAVLENLIPNALFPG